MAHLLRCACSRSSTYQIVRLVALASRGLMPRRAIDQAHALQRASQSGPGHCFIVFTEPMGKIPHTDMASLAVAFTNPLSNHRLQRRLDALWGLAFGCQSRYGDLSCFMIRAENLFHGTLAQSERLGNTSYGILR